MENSFENQRKIDLITEIISAFQMISREDGATWHEALVVSNFGNSEECARAREQDEGHIWQDVTDQELLEGYDAFAFLDAKGFRYYLPAYTVWYVRHIDNADSNSHLGAFRFLLSSLKGDAHNSTYETPFSVFRQLSIQQKEAMAHFLIFAAKREERVRQEYEAMERIHPVLDDAIVWERMKLAKQSGERIAREYFRPETPAQDALDKYWGQFL